MLLAVDIGNSGIKFGLFDKNNISEPVCSFSVVSGHILRSTDEYEITVRQILNAKGYTDNINASVISSVVPSVTPTIAEVVKRITGKEPFIIGSGIKTGFGIKTEDPGLLGADIVSNTAGALSLCKPPIVIADLGTATTLTAVDRNFDILGTIIIPGLKISLDALLTSAELLNSISISKPQKFIGANSADSIRSGVINGNIFMIDGFLRNLREELLCDDEKLSLVSTGGLSDIVIPYCRNKFINSKHLTLIGSALLYYKNKK